jgi:4-hydroxy-tetrahydrodipicolinate reductase
MKVAVVGTGKTGGCVLELLDQKNVVGPFNSRCPITPKALRDADVAVVFVSPAAFDEVAKVLIAAKLPAVIATTGVDFTKYAKRLKAAKTAWVVASNFSLSMQLMRKSLQVFQQADRLVEDPRFAIHEIHHADKVDAPSGTALSWQKWLQQSCEMTHNRVGDVFGVHECTIETENETMTIRHEAKNRGIFARGAIWAARNLLGKSLQGVVSFDQFFDETVK